MLKIDKVSKSFGGIIATDNVSMKIQPNSINALIGPNGAGKTTLFNLITGKIDIDEGQIFIENNNITNLKESEITHLGIARAFQITNIFPTLSVQDSIKVALLAKQHGLNNMWNRFKAHSINNEAESIAKLSGLTKSYNTISSALSHGDQKLLDIALALALKPKVLLLDEPTAGMGPEERWKMIDRIQKLWKKTKMTVLFIEHDMDIVFDIAQNIYVLQQGAIIAEGTPKEIKSNKKVIKAYLGGGKK
jgi:branched-chain amino acid transport system ATP-binding protein